mgnify:CR=1 FL=1|tara:strand:- start:2598 stop:3653 length:1056 start_codon:yes stop_codon:yes gene_type:complete
MSKGIVFAPNVSEETTHSTLFVKRYGVATGEGTFKLPVFLEDFSDSYNSQWEKQSVFGRSDPMQFYGGTQRSISATFALVAPSVSFAQANLSLVKRMTQALYPRYKEGAISSTPLIGLKFENFIREGNDYLVGTMGNFSVTPDFESGVFGKQDYFNATEEHVIVSANENNPKKQKSITSLVPDGVEIYPKIIRISFDFTPIHRSTLGFTGADGVFSESSFPYLNSNEKEAAAFQIDAAYAKLMSEIDKGREMINEVYKERKEDAIKPDTSNFIPNDELNKTPNAAKEAHTAPGSPAAHSLSAADKALVSSIDNEVEQYHKFIQASEDEAVINSFFAHIKKLEGAKETIVNR